MTLREETLFSQHPGPYAHVCSIIFALLSAESPHTSPEVVLLGELVGARESLRVQEEDFLLLCVQKCFAPS